MSDDYEFEGLEEGLKVSSPPPVIPAGALEEIEEPVIELKVDPFAEIMERLRKEREWQPVYPLSLTREECLRLGWSRYRGTQDPKGKRYKEDSLKSFEVVEDPIEEFRGGRMREFWAAADGDRTCLVCHGRQEYDIVYRGIETNFFWRKTCQCLCETRRMYRRMLAFYGVPLSLRKVNIGDLSPSPKSCLSIGFQEKEIAFLRKHSSESFFFLGPPGSSKTTFSAALFNLAVWRSCSLHNGDKFWRVDGNHLFETEVAYATANDKESVQRDITPDEIRRARRKGGYGQNPGFPVLLLEEIDKRKMTEFSANILFRLIDAMVESEGQLFLTTNLTEKGFRRMFLDSDIEAVRVTGGAIIRRLFENEKINVRDYHGKEA